MTWLRTVGTSFQRFDFLLDNSNWLEIVSKRQHMAPNNKDQVWILILVYNKRLDSIVFVGLYSMKGLVSPFAQQKLVVKGCSVVPWQGLMMTWKGVAPSPLSHYGPRSWSSVGFLEGGLFGRSRLSYTLASLWNLGWCPTLECTENIVLVVVL